MHRQKNNFWKNVPLSKMTRSQWESLCDGCGRCCLNKLEDENGEIFFTDIACRFLDHTSCRCQRYNQRTKVVSDCLALSPDKTHDFRLLPETCAYRRLSEGKSLPHWHPLISGDSDSIHHSGISVRNKCISEEKVLRRHWDSHIIKLST